MAFFSLRQRQMRAVFKRHGGKKGTRGVLVQTAKGLADNGLWCIGKLNGILRRPDFVLITFCD